MYETPATKFWLQYTADRKAQLEREHRRWKTGTQHASVSRGQQLDLVMQLEWIVLDCYKRWAEEAETEWLDFMECN